MISRDGKGTLFLAVLFCLAALRCMGDGEPRVLSAYESPEGVYHAVLQNPGAESLTLQPKALRHPADGAPVHVWWMRMQPEVMQPKGMAHFSFAVKRTPPALASVDLLLDREPPEPLRLSIRKPPLLPAYLVQDAATKTLYLYLRNDGDAEVTVSAVAINGVALTLDASLGIATVAAGGRALLFGTASGVEAAPPSTLPAFVDLTTSVGEAKLFTPLFPSTQFSTGPEEAEATQLTCPTHKHGHWDLVGDAIFRYAEGATDRIPTIHFCRNRLPEGLHAFAQCTPRGVVNLQASNLERGEDKPWTGFYDVARITKTAYEPGVYAALIENASMYHGAYGQATSPKDPPLSVRELRAIAYGALAHGAKGLQFRPPAPGATEHRAHIEALEKELAPLHPYLALAEPVDLVQRCSAEDMLCHTLLCGDKGALLIVLRHGAPEAEATEPVVVVLSLPPWADFSDYIEVGGARQQGQATRRGREAAFSVRVPESVAAFLLVPPCIGSKT